MDSFIKFMAHDAFPKKLRDNKLSRGQLLAYRDFQDNFQRRVNQTEIQLQVPISEKLTQKEVVNLYSARLEGSFTAKQFSDRTGMNKNTARREIQSAVKRGIIEKLPTRKKTEGKGNQLQEYRYT